MEDRYGVRGQKDHSGDHQRPLGRTFPTAHQHCSFSGCCRHACRPHWSCDQGATLTTVLARRIPRCTRRHSQPLMLPTLLADATPHICGSSAVLKIVSLQAAIRAPSSAADHSSSVLATPHT